MRIQRVILTVMAIAALGAPAKGESLVDLIDPQAPTQVGFEARALGGEVRESFQAHKLFSPASVLKLVTAAAALEILGPDSRIPTVLGTDGFQQGKTLKGNLYLKGYGDPSLRQADLDDFVKALQARGIQRIEGDLVADASAFDEEAYPPGWMQEDLAWDYAPPIRAIALDGNGYAFKIIPGKKPGEPLAFPAIDGLKILNEAKTVSGSGQLKVQRKPTGLQVSGTLGTKDAPVLVEGALPDPPLAAIGRLAEKMKRAGVVLAGSLRVGQAPTPTEDLLLHQSAPLRELVRHMNKHSDNLYAECLLRQLGEGSRQRGLKAVDKILEKAGWNPGSYCVVDGSGLSRYNALTPTQLTQLLVYAQALPGFKDSLPVAGVDGTLRNRLRGIPLVAKTGTMAGVCAIAGYLETSKGPVAVTVLINGFVGAAAPQRALQDRLIQGMIK